MGTITEIRKYRCEWCDLPRNHEGAHVHRFTPTWMRRMQVGQLKAKDLTGPRGDAA